MAVDNAPTAVDSSQPPIMHNMSMVEEMGGHDTADRLADTKQIHLPTITLDQTLSDLYKQTCPSLRNKRIGHIFCGTTCAVDLSPNFPRNKKYIYQDGSFNDASRLEKTDDQVKGSLAPKYLSLIPQRDAFIAGPDPVIFFYSGQSDAEIAHDEAEADLTLAVLDEAQRPGPVFCSGPGDVRRICDEHGIDGLAVKLVVDQVAASTSGTSKMLIEPDTLWYLNGKEALAKSGLPTPATDVIEVQAHCPEIYNCCEACVASKSDDIDPGCTGRRSRWIGEQTMRILSALERKPLPFVFKNQQAFAGAGTYVVTDGEHRHRLVHELTYGGLLSRLFCRITEDNAHLGPGSILLMEMVQNPVNDIGLTFFVGEDGTATYLAASEQMIDRATSAWIGSKISYTHQDELEKKLSPLMDQIAAFLHKHNYFGPVGADLLETPDGDFQIVDLNVRTSGSLCLPLMKTHFTSRGLQCASSLSITTTKSRKEFSEQWRAALESGELCIVAWYEDEKAGKSYGDVVVGATDEEGLTEILGQVRDSTEKVTF